MNLKFYQNFSSKKIALSLMVALGLSAQVQSQTVDEFHKCGSDVKKFIAENPEFESAYHQFEANWAEYLENINVNSLERSYEGKYIIPVVVHVLHLGGSENISAAQVKSQITALNTLFAMESSGLAGLSSFPAFDTLVPYFNGEDTVRVAGPGSQLLNRFEFRLATKDPNGNCTDGIVRVYTEKADDAENGTRFKQVSNWDRSHYFNFWVIKSFPDASLLGYAQFPFAFGGQFPLTSTDGVAVVHGAFGTTGTAAGQTGATPTHEAGHWLGLFHIWGDDFCASDGIDDTPIHYGPNFCSGGTPALGNPPTNTVSINTGIHCPPSLPYTAECYYDTNSTDSALNVLNLKRRNEIGRQWMNIMDYTNDEYQWMFTEQQYRKMNVTMETIAFRTSLNDSTNILATGTDDASQTTRCHGAPIADLWSRDGSNNFVIQKLICAGGDLTFKDGTYNLSNPGTDQGTRDWAFEGGAPGTSTASSPLVTYATPGVYDVKLTATNDMGSNTKLWDNYVMVLPTAADEVNFAYYDDFEYSTSLYEQGKWIIINQGVNANNKWEQATNSGYQSAKSMVIRNSGNIIYEQDFLISAAYDMTSITNDKLYFRFAGARKTSNPFITQNDMLQVYISTNCGENWTARAMKVKGVTKNYLSGDTLYSAGLVSGNFVPNNNSDWTLAEVDLATFTSASNLRVMWVWTSGGPNGNDFYIDQINITNSTAIGIENEAEQMDYNVYPNPVSSISQVYFKLPGDSKVTLDVIDITGRTVKTIFSGDLNAGEQYYQLNNADFQSAGIYMVRLNVDGVVSTKKVIIE